jgi:sarcosine oxidase subunit alpha
MPDTHSPIGRTPLHHWHTAHGGHFLDRDGWQVVAAYDGAELEAKAARTGLGLADISAFAKISLRGPGVASLIPSLLPDGAALRPGSVAVLAADSALVCRLTEDQLLVLAATPASTVLAERLAGLREGRAVAQTDVTSTYAGFALIGPQLDESVRRLTHLDIRRSSLPVNSCAETLFAGVEALLVRPDGRSLPEMRIYVAWDLGEYVWERILQAGPDGRCTTLGLEALGQLQ